MPLRKDYECLDCDLVFEINKDQGDGDFPENPTCPYCESINTKSSFRNIKTTKIGINIPVYMRSGH